MSKVDAQRAMREARYAAMQAQAAAARRGTPAQPPAPASPRPTDAAQSPDPAGARARRTGTKRAAAAPEVEAAPVGGAGLCGHRSIGNKSCQRPAGHAEKNHRYK